MASAQNLLGFCFFACASETPFSWIWVVACRLPSLTLRCALLEATFRNLFSLFLVGSKNNVSALFWLRFRMVWALYFFLFWAHYTSFFLVGSKSDVSAFFWLRFRNGFGTKPAGALLFRMRSRRSFLGLCMVAAVSQWLGHDFIVFRGSKRNVFRMRSRRSFLGLCLVAAVSQWLGHDFIVFRGSKSNTFSLFLRVPKAKFRDFWGCTPAMAWTQNLLGLCFFGCAPDAAFLGFAWWLQFRSGWGTISLFLGVPKATRFHCFSLFLGAPKATFRDFWGCTPAMAWTQNLLGLCFFGCAPDAAFLGFAWWLQFCSGWGTISLFLGIPKATFRDFCGCTPAMAWTQNLLGLCFFGCAPDASFLGFARWLKFLQCSFLTLRWSFPQASKS